MNPKAIHRGFEIAGLLKGRVGRQKMHMCLNGKKAELKRDSKWEDMEHNSVPESQPRE